ncbi:MAG TPA: hypothetical protein PLB47_07060 [Solirubrobacterales bacterium]|nr:hypothetical protein [Solirubrobacterales bacterium]HMU27781.1 hypothetical protein [Solirubrobacterales bacterium]HMY26260.1 hypothetical protein [Solirubrobacterales bacterium]HNA45311.1 hypothetical protein [Solirubrobacterales bacterium]HNC93562.1 hypothetical protein [Solirubrobacterales bacterium]
MSHWLTGFLPACAPLLLLVLLLLLGRYPGERAIERVHRALSDWLGHSFGGRVVEPQIVFVPVPDRGGRLIARSLAGRAPPCFI